MKEISYKQIRKIAERYRFIHPVTGRLTVSTLVPDGVKKKEKEPYLIQFLTGGGYIVKGKVTTAKVEPSSAKRLVKFVDSGEYRWVSDIFIISINDIRVVVH